MQAALQIGLQNLTMRGLATTLGVGASTLYYHVGSLEELRGMVRDRLLAGLQLPAPDVPWDEALLGTGRQLRGLFEAAPGLADAALADAEWSHVLLTLHEAACAQLRAAGFDAGAAWLAIRTVAEFVEGFVARQRARARAGFADLADLWPEAEHPNLVAARRALPDPDEARFEFGLTCIIRGLEGARRPATRPAKPSGPP